MQILTLPTQVNTREQHMRAGCKQLFVVDQWRKMKFKWVGLCFGGDINNY